MTPIRSLALAALAVAILCCSVGSAYADTYYLWDDWGGTWSDAEKSRDNSEDDLMCWAASSSNVLQWTGWGKIDGMKTSDDMFGYFQDHWTDLGGNPYYGWDWWFDGSNDGPSWSPWSQVDQAGGGFYTLYDIGDYRRYSSTDSAALDTLDDWLHDGYGTTLSVAGPGGHSITCWGFDTDTSGDYDGIWVTDSDDDKGGNAPRPDSLAYYEVEYTSGKWYLKDFYGTDNWYITELVALGKMPVHTPLPSAAWLGLALLGTLIAVRTIRRRRRW